MGYPDWEPPGIMKAGGGGGGLTLITFELIGIKERLMEAGQFTFFGWQQAQLQQGHKDQSESLEIHSIHVGAEAVPSLERLPAVLIGGVSEVGFSLGGAAAAWPVAFAGGFELAVWCRSNKFVQIGRITTLKVIQGT